MSAWCGVREHAASRRSSAARVLRLRIRLAALRAELGRALGVVTALAAMLLLGQRGATLAQNLPRAVRLLHAGQVTAWTWSTFFSARKSTDFTFSIAWSRAAWACAAAISSSRSGAQLSHSPAFLFQHTGSQTHWPQRVHCLKSGRISVTASFSAESWAGPATMDSSCWAPAAARPEDAAEQRRGGVGRSRDGAHGVGLEGRLVAVARTSGRRT